MLGLHGYSWPDLPHVQRHQEQAGVLPDGYRGEEGVAEHSPDVGKVGIRWTGQGYHILI